jgi:hypothetical protein
MRRASRLRWTPVELSMYPVATLEVETMEGEAMLDKCELDRPVPMHAFIWGDPARPGQTEPDADARCQCGATTWAEEKAKHGLGPKPAEAAPA